MNEQRAGRRRWRIGAAWALLVWAGLGCTGAGEETRDDATNPAAHPTSAPESAPSSMAALPRVELEASAKAPFWGAEGAGRVDASRIKADLDYLADDAREGRGVGTEGLRQATDRVAASFKEAGLEPAGDGGGWFQTFKVVVGASLGPDAEQGLIVEKTALPLNEAWRPFAFSESGEVTAPIVFAGYGISAPDLGYDDYAGLDVKDKIVLVLRHEPQRADPQSKFNGDAPSQYSDLRYKAHVAKRLGAAGLLIVNGPADYASPKENDPDELYRFQGSADGGILAAHLTWKGAGAWVTGKLGVDLKDAQARIDADLKPQSRDLGRSATLKINVKRTETEVRNVVGVLRAGAEPPSDEVVVVGAHVDHLGLGGENSLRPDVKAVHNGADDNASGTSVLMELARVLGQERASLKRSIYFVAFTAEEIGIRGSQHFVDHPPVEVKRFAAMVNFDMVGRLREGTLYVSGVGTAREFASLSDEAASDLELKIVQGRDGYGPSDHSPFYAKEVPVLFLFTGPHDQYHTPEDDAPLINVEGAAQVTRYARRLVGYLASAPARPTYTTADTRVVGDSGGSGAPRGYGPYLGTVPSFGDTGGQGVKLQGVRPGSPAEQAGIRGDDVIVEFAGTAIKDLYDLTYALRDRKPGDAVEIVVLRGGARVKVTATLGKR